MEERIKIQASRKAAAKRLLSVLFDKAKVVKQKEEIRRRMQILEEEKRQKLLEEKEKEDQKEKTRQAMLLKEKLKRKEQLLRQEQLLREKILQNLQRKQKVQQRDHEILTRTKLKSVLVPTRNEQTSSDSIKETNIPKLKSVLVVNN